MAVRVLPDHVVNCISAGEVIDRPASVVRELVDNAIDAGATDITVYSQSAGQTLIRIVDDGGGMSRDDALLAFERHATSKLCEIRDLDEISTMGFRGEALSSIAAVSKVRLTTRTQGDPAATAVAIVGGKLKDVSSCAGNLGTDVEVRALFFNTPARRKFLRSARTEELRIKNWLHSAAAAHPGVRYRYFEGAREVLHLIRRNSFLERAGDIIRGSTVPFEHQVGDLKTAGIIAHPAMAQAESSSLIILVNKRLVSDRMLLRAVREGFDSTLKEREFPVGVVHVELPPALLDVNVHPQKAEVRFREPQAVFQLVRDGVLHAVREFRAPMRGMGGVGVSAGAAASYSSHLQFSQASAANTALAFNYSRAPSFTAPTPEVCEGPERLPEQRFVFSSLRYIGQLLECYLLCETDGRFYVVDMHAAHERYNFNLIRSRLADRGLDSQRLLVPLTVDLTEQGFLNCFEHQHILKLIGLEIEPFGQQSVMVRAAPAVLPVQNVAQLVKEVAAIPLEEPADGVVAERLGQMAARLACHASVRSGKKIERDEVYALFDALDSTEFSAACPHGRPVVISFSEAEVERWFGRDR